MKKLLPFCFLLFGLQTVHAQLKSSQGADKYFIYQEHEGDMGGLIGLSEMDFLTKYKGRIKSVHQSTEIEDLTKYYNEKGDLIKTESVTKYGGIVSKDTSIITYSYIYNNDGQITEMDESHSDQHRQKLNKIIFQYDKKQNLIEEESYHIDSKNDKKITFQYDKNNGVTELAISLLDNTPTKPLTVYKYSYILNKFTIKQTDPENRTFTYLFENNNFIQSNVYRGNKPITIDDKYRYDSKGNLIEIDSYDSPSGALQNRLIFKYLKFDSQGNWLQRKEFQVSGTGRDYVESIMQSVVRKIEYYN
ncbi:MAG: hypothetical protein V4560_16660 [Bacteroidota bacterium]